MNPLHQPLTVMKNDLCLSDRYLVARWFTAHREKLRPQPFESERTRWLVLVVSLLMTAGHVPEDQSRSAANTLAALDLLDVAACASLPADVPRQELIEKVLRDEGFAAENAACARRALIELAQAVQRRWEGKIQCYLRAWGERMLAELPTDFGIAALPADDVRCFFTKWLQDALGMPVVMAHPLLLELAKQNGTTLDALVAAADSLDLNVALLDEAGTLEMASRRTEET